jgi:hypothetical protein
MKISLLLYSCYLLVAYSFRVQNKISFRKCSTNISQLQVASNSRHFKTESNIAFGVGLILGSLFFLGPAHADESTKKFESCLSKCIFAETRPPPLNAPIERIENVRSRAEITLDCKKQCFTKKEQLLLGKPKAKNENPPTPSN